jgi:hypothetical protein
MGAGFLGPLFEGALNVLGGLAQRFANLLLDDAAFFSLPLVSRSLVNGAVGFENLDAIEFDLARVFRTP